MAVVDSLFERTRQRARLSTNALGLQYFELVPQDLFMLLNLSLSGELQLHMRKLWELWVRSAL